MKNLKIFLILALVIVLGFILDRESNDQQGKIAGRVSIGPLCPVEPCPGTPENPYVSRVLILKPAFGEPIKLPLDSEGNFSGLLNQGSYSANLSDCQFLGCQYSLPKKVTIKKGETAELNIDIDTGIR
jgi:hypothetical protein